MTGQDLEAAGKELQGPFRRALSLGGNVRVAIPIHSRDARRGCRRLRRRRSWSVPLLSGNRLERLVWRRRVLGAHCLHPAG